MSATVSYKGETLTTVNNATKTLLTEGKYLEDDITIVDVTQGGSATLIEKSITANGTYNASSDSADGYSKVVVSVPASAVDTGTKSITANGNNQDVVGYAAVNVNVPNSYSAGDEGKVVSGGALVSQTSDTVTQNDTYDTTLINSLTVAVSGGGSVGTVNILSGVGLNAGYLGTNGTPQAQTTSKEVYTDEIDVSAHIGETMFLLVATGGSAGGQWLGYCAYDANHSFISPRNNISPTGNANGLGYAFTVPSCKYIRLSFRTFGNARYCAGYLSDIFSAMSDDGWGEYISA